MADKHGKRKRDDDAVDGLPRKHQKTETAVDYSAHTYVEVDPNAYYDYSVSPILIMQSNKQLPYYGFKKIMNKELD